MIQVDPQVLPNVASEIEAMTLQLQQRDWALRIAFAQHYRLASPLEIGTIKQSVPTFEAHYKDTIMWHLVDCVAEAQEVAKVQLLDSEQIYDTSLTAYGVLGETKQQEAKAMGILARGFDELGIEARLYHNLDTEGISCCVVDTARHDPTKIVALTSAPFVWHEGRVFKRK
jgi:hypothetical protein